MVREDASIDLRSYLKVLSRRRWVIVVTLLTVVLATAIITWRLTPVYEGVAQVEVQPTSSSSSDASRTLEALVDPTRGLQTQVKLVESDTVLQLAAKQLGLPSAHDVKDGLSVELLPDTQIVEIRMEHERPDEARNWANAVAEAYLDFRRDRVLKNSLEAGEDIIAEIEELQRRIVDLDLRTQQDPEAAATIRTDRDRAIIRLSALETERSQLPDAQDVERGGGNVIATAQLPDGPVRPRKALSLMLSVLIGFLLGLGLALVAENLDDRLKNPEEVEDRVGAPVLGYIPLVKEWNESQSPGLAILSTTASGAAEAYRTLKTNLRFVSLERPLRTILVTSPVAGAGKSTTAANLAATLAQGGSKVVLVSADLRRPAVHKIFALTNSKGIVDVVDPDLPLEGVLQKPNISSLRLLAAGGLPPNPTEILASERFNQILIQLRGLADYVIVDSPPVLGLGDSSALASRVDGILMVIRTGLVTKREVSHASDQLRKAGGTIAGCVLNAVDAEDGYGYYYHYYYSQYQTNGNGSEAGKDAEKILDLQANGAVGGQARKQDSVVDEVDDSSEKFG